MRARVRGVEGIGERERVKQAGDEGRDGVRGCSRWAGCGRHEWPAVRSGLPLRVVLSGKAYAPPWATRTEHRRAHGGHMVGT